MTLRSSVLLLLFCFDELSFSLRRVGWARTGRSLKRAVGVEGLILAACSWGDVLSVCTVCTADSDADARRVLGFKVAI